MSVCNVLIRGLQKDCEAIKVGGGVKPLVFIGTLSMLDEVVPFTTASDYVDAFNFAVNGSMPYKLKRFETKKDRFAGTFEGNIGDNFNTVNQSATLPLYWETPAQKQAIEALIGVDDAFVIFQRNNGSFHIYGLEKGMELSALTGGTGTVLQDDFSTIVTLSGEQLNLPEVFKTAPNSTPAQDLTYLLANSEF
jgi:hypothetical protein